MSLNKEFFDRKTNITAKVICDSISPDGIRMTTLEVEAPRIILAEINTHNAISKNCSSTRAITLSKAIDQVKTNGFTPLYWGEKKKGMSADKEIDDIEYANNVWQASKEQMIGQVGLLDDEKVHKQIAGRLLEPFQMVKQVLSATDWDNFFNLRIHKTAQPEICMLAYKIYKAVEESTPTPLREGEWHLPYLNTERNYNHKDDDHTGDIVYFTGSISDDNLSQLLTLDEAIKISASCCAQVSYRNTDESLEKAEQIFDMLVKADVLHASCFEHLATPIVFKETNEMCNVFEYLDKVDGVTHVNKQGELCSGNLRGWVSYRHLLPNNTCWKFDFEERIKSFD